MVKSYIKLIGIFRGKQAKHNTQILSILYDNGPLTAWEITGKIRKVGRVSLHATLNKRLRSLEKKGYLDKAGKKWCLRFKGIVAAVLIQKTPKPLSNKWSELLESFAKNSEEHFSILSKVTIQAGDVIFHPLEAIKESGQMLKTFDDWITLSNYIKGLMQKGVINLDVISNETLFTLILSEFSHERVKALMKDWNIKAKRRSPNSSKGK